MTYNITVQGSSETHECDEHEPILECLERNHMLVECDCRVGVCGTCKVELITGTVDQDEHRKWWRCFPVTIEGCFNIENQDQVDKIKNIMETCVELNVPSKVDIALGQNFGEAV